MSRQRGAGARQGLWLLREFAADERGAPRAMLAIHSIVGETFGVSDATARRWVEGHLASPRYLEEMRQRWGLAFVIHLFDDASTPARQEAIWKLRQLDDGVAAMVREREALLVQLGADPESLFRSAAAVPPSVRAALAARIFADLVETERRAIPITILGRLRARLGRT
ncbi:hypothetical protein J2847_004113 [Azospirillum agricola]|uniref:hypothetical protein n=1 Tax=Azospirillum agricola TaxID=1720247 RepID=UPI001AE7C126|nr:hypothetical protein [Azospirillum agricola]MBP2230804.1 hypothetical protein [Azospirillum agricola]